MLVDDPERYCRSLRDDHSVIPEKGELGEHAHGCHPGAGAPYCVPFPKPTLMAERSTVILPPALV